MKVSWTVYESVKGHVEAQVFEPDQPSSKLILFCPGFPGAGATVFEQRHAATFAAAEFTLVVLKHSGTRLQGPQAPQMINNAWRLSQARKNGDTHLGGGPSTIEHWLIEPLIALQSLADQYDQIDVIGNSFGALASMWSLTMPEAKTAKIRNFLLMAGAQAFHLPEIWKPEFITLPRITEKVTLNEPVQIVAALTKVYQELPLRMKILPANIHLTYLVVERDELLRPAQTQEFQAAIGGRGKIVIDNDAKGYPEHGLLAHDLPDYPTENLLSLLRINES